MLNAQHSANLYIQTDIYDLRFPADFVVQRAVVNQLKADMESLQEEIKAQLVSILQPFVLYSKLYTMLLPPLESLPLRIL